jgi:hypothetical protein
VVLLLSNELAVDNLVALLTHIVVERLDDRIEVKPLWNRVDPILAFRASVVVVGALEQEADTFGHEANVASLSPDQEIQGNLTESIVLAHIVHGVSPPIECRIQRFGSCRFPTLHTFETLESRIL